VKRLGAAEGWGWSEEFLSALVFPPPNFVPRKVGRAAYFL